MAEARERPAAGGHNRVGLVQWALIMAPLLIAFKQQVAFVFVDPACVHSSLTSLHLTSAIALALVLVIGLLSGISLRRTDTGNVSGGGAMSPRLIGPERGDERRGRFMGILAVTAAAFSALLIIGQWMPALFIHPCQL